MTVAGMLGPTSRLHAARNSWTFEVSFRKASTLTRCSRDRPRSPRAARSRPIISGTCEETERELTVSVPVTLTPDRNSKPFDYGLSLPAWHNREHADLNSI